MRMQEEPVAETPLLGSHFEPEEPEHEEEEPQPKGRSVPPPPNTFSEAEALRWPAIREALADETRRSVGQGLAVRVVRGMRRSARRRRGEQPVRDAVLLVRERSR